MAFPPLVHKYHQSQSFTGAAPPVRRSRRGWCHLVLALAICVFWYYHLREASRPSSLREGVVLKPGNLNKKFLNWSDIAPNRDLKWQKCYDGKYECARLDVPLDWQDFSGEDRIVIAVIRLRAKTEDDYRGPVFINPGGPGGSGVSWLLKIGEQLQTIIGENHDIISWDPRGVGESVPRIDCWGSMQKRNEWDGKRIQVIDSHPGIVYDALAQASAYSRQCEAYMSTVTPKLLEHISTVVHARDMLEISKKAGFDKVKYWGVSYGTILGGEFAATFPNNVERLVSDGNVDYNAWYLNEQIRFLEDADKIMDAFFSFCHIAGPAKCAFYSHTPSAIQARFLTLLARLKRQPVELPTHTAYNGTLPIVPELITYAKIQLLVRNCLYKPIYKFPALASVLNALEAGDGLPYYEMVHEGETEPFLDLCPTNSTVPSPAEVAASSDDAFPAIMCSDGEPFDETPETFQDYAAALQNISKYAGASNAHFKLACAGRQIRPRWRGAVPSTGTQTAFPILFIGNIADNVTPLQSARNNSATFPRSALLVQRSYGHASVAAPSTCSAVVVRAYFQNGSLPAADTYCDQDYALFEDPPSFLEAGAEDRFSIAVRELSIRANFAF